MQPRLSCDIPIFQRLLSTSTRTGLPLSRSSVQEGVEIWFDPDKNWAGFHEQCQKRVHKQGYKSGPGDRALFGWTVEEGDAFLSEDQIVHWTEDEGEKGTEEEVASLDNDDDNAANKGNAGMTSFAVKLKAAKRHSKSRGLDKEGKNKKGKSNASRATAKPKAADSGNEEEKSADEESRSKKQQLGRLTWSVTKHEHDAASQADDVEPKAKKGRKSVTQSVQVPLELEPPRSKFFPRNFRWDKSAVVGLQTEGDNAFTLPLLPHKPTASCHTTHPQSKLNRVTSLCPRTATRLGVQLPCANALRKNHPSAPSPCHHHP
jgi:hypothetical protein